MSGQYVHPSCRCPQVRLVLRPLPHGPDMCCNGPPGPAQVSSGHREVRTLLLHKVRVPGEQGCDKHCLGVSEGFASLSSKIFLKQCSRRASAVQDCKGDATDFRWNVTHSADSWEQEYGWPADNMWAESIWPAGQPAFALFQVRLPVHSISHPCLVQGF